jgi:hypothetical protein
MVDGPRHVVTGRRASGPASTLAWALLSATAIAAFACGSRGADVPEVTGEFSPCLDPGDEGFAVAPVALRLAGLATQEERERTDSQ